MKRGQLEQTIQDHLGSLLTLLLVGVTMFIIGSHHQPVPTSNTATFTATPPKTQPTASVVINELETVLAQELPSETSVSTGSEEILLSTSHININNATQAELESLPGIGPAKAQAIIEYRQQNGPFLSLNDLGKVKGIGPKNLETLKNSITF